MGLQFIGLFWLIYISLMGDLVYGCSFHWVHLATTARFDCDWFYNVDIIYGYLACECTDNASI